MRQFIPMTDELLYRPGGPPGDLVPYRTGVACWHALGADGIYHFAEMDFVPSPLRAHAALPSAQFGKMYTATAEQSALGL
jgi:hypothetical protein